MSSPWLRYDAATMDDGSIVVDASTNDNRDRGYDSEDAFWQLRFDNRAAFDRQIGRSRTGISGIQVTVMLDGEVLR